MALNVFFDGVVRACTIAAVATFGWMSAPASAQDGALSIELNSLAALQGGGCRLTFVFTNGTDVPLSEMTYNVVVFNSDGRVVGGLLQFPFEAIDTGRTRVVFFPISSPECSDISRILFNEVSACTAADTGEPTDICSSALSMRSLEDSVFIGN